MDRKVSKYFQLSPSLSEDTVVQRELFKVKEVRDRRRRLVSSYFYLEFAQSFIFLQRVETR